MRVDSRAVATFAVAEGIVKLFVVKLSMFESESVSEYLLNLIFQWHAPSYGCILL